MVYHEPCDNRSLACQREAAIKKLTRAKKLALISTNPV
jgi:predicted GIY-YIG superfamily endonuclease